MVVPVTKRLLCALVRRTRVPVVVTARKNGFDDAVALYAHRPPTLNGSWVGTLFLREGSLEVCFAYAATGTRQDRAWFTLGRPTDVTDWLRERLREALDDHRLHVREEVRELVHRTGLDLALPGQRRRLRELLGEPGRRRGSPRGRRADP